MAPRAWRLEKIRWFFEFSAKMHGAGGRGRLHFWSGLPKKSNNTEMMPLHSSEQLCNSGSSTIIDCSAMSSSSSLTGSGGSYGSTFNTSAKYGRRNETVVVHEEEPRQHNHDNIVGDRPFSFRRVLGFITVFVLFSAGVSSASSRWTARGTARGTHLSGPDVEPTSDGANVQFEVRAQSKAFLLLLLFCGCTTMQYDVI